VTATADLVPARIPSRLADLRDVRLADFDTSALPPDLADAISRAVSGVMPDPQAVLVPVAAFQSAI